MRKLFLIVPGSLETRTGGYGYDRRIVAGLRDRGWEVVVRELDDGFPQPTAAARAEADRVLAAMPDDAIVVVDGLAFGALPVEAARESGRLRLVALVHHPLAEETGLDPKTASDLEVSERRALASARRVVVTSRATAAALAGYGVAPDRLAVVEPGTDRAPLARGSRGGPVQLLVVAALVPRKGHDILLRALAAVPERDWRLTCVGSLERDPATVARVRARIRADALDDRVSLAGETDGTGVAAHYDAADLFVLPTRYEGYGMAVAEALARGIPVIGTPTGGIADLVGGGAGVLVPVGDVDALTAALSEVLRDKPMRERLAVGARRVRERLPTWDDAAARMATILEGVAADERIQR